MDNNYHCKNCYCNKETSEVHLRCTAKNEDLQVKSMNRISNADINVDLKEFRSSASADSTENFEFSDDKNELNTFVWSEVQEGKLLLKCRGSEEFQISLTNSEIKGILKSRKLSKNSNNIKSSTSSLNTISSDKKFLDVNFNNKDTNESGVSCQDCSESLLCELPYISSMVNKGNGCDDQVTLVDSIDSYVESFIEAEQMTFNNDSVDKSLLNHKTMINQDSYVEKPVLMNDDKDSDQYDVLDEQSCSESLLQNGTLDTVCMTNNKGKNNSKTLNQTSERILNKDGKFEKQVRDSTSGTTLPSSNNLQRNSRQLTDYYNFSKNKYNELEELQKTGSSQKSKFFNHSLNSISQTSKDSESEISKNLIKPNICSDINSNSLEIIDYINEELDVEFNAEKLLQKQCNLDETSVIDINRHNFEAGVSNDFVDSSEKVEVLKKPHCKEDELNDKANNLFMSPLLKRNEDDIKTNMNEESLSGSDSDASFSESDEMLKSEHNNTINNLGHSRRSTPAQSNGKIFSKNKMPKTKLNMEDSSDKEISQLCKLPTVKKKKEHTKNIKLCGDEGLEEKDLQVQSKMQNFVDNESDDCEIVFSKLKQFKCKRGSIDSNINKVEQMKKRKLENEEHNSTDESDSSIDFANYRTSHCHEDHLLKTKNDIAREMLLSTCNDSASSTYSNDDPPKSKKFKRCSKKHTESKSTSDADKNGDTSDSKNDFTSVKKNRKSHRLLTFPLSDRESDEKIKQNTSVSRKVSRKVKCLGEPRQMKRSTHLTSTESSSSSDDDLFLPLRKEKSVNQNLTIRSNSSEKNDDFDLPQSASQNLINSSVGSQRKNIREVMSQASLEKETRLASQAEIDRRRRIASMQEMYNQIAEVNEQQNITKKFVLEINPETKEEIVEIHPDIIKKLKPHQVEGVKFMWQCTIESIKQLESSPGSGCILAHCMGLGKTLQVIAFLHTVLSNKYTFKYLKTALVVCPCNTILNWYSEFSKWLDSEELKLNVVEMTNIKTHSLRSDCLSEWQRKGGVMLISYSMYRKLAQVEKLTNESNQVKETFLKALVNPGPDIVVCDEGHMLKNDKSFISKSISQLKSLRRIVLTGTPLQNNLIEYHCMVNFVKRNLLGTRKEFLNRFVNPIKNGQCVDSSSYDVKLMKKRVHILHTMLEGFVQRYDYSSLAAYLPIKHEYVLSIKLSESQINLYKCYLKNFGPVERTEKNSNAGSELFRDFNILRLIWTHPYILYDYTKKKEVQKFQTTITNLFSSKKADNECEDEMMTYVQKLNEKHFEPSTSSKNDKIDIVTTDFDENVENEVNDKGNFYQNREFRQMIEKERSSDVWFSGKVIIFLNVLQKCEEIGDKLLVFSQSLKTLDFIEEILKNIQEESRNNPVQDYCIKTWNLGLDYFRLDGSTNVEQRKKTISLFNDKENYRARLFLISTKAGSLGANMTGANRVILMDTSWNPSHDIQAIFRVYRFGQTKPVYVYRLLAHGTMEEKIYDRQVTKQSLSFRVVDDQQMERHFTFADLMDLYKFDPYKQSNRPTPIVPKDKVLAELLIHHRETISAYHEHDSLLQSANEVDLTEEERKAAWIEYEAEKEMLFHRTEKLKAPNNFGTDNPLQRNNNNLFSNFMLNHQLTESNAEEIVQKLMQQKNLFYLLLRPANTSHSSTSLQQNQQMDDRFYMQQQISILINGIIMNKEHCEQSELKEKKLSVMNHLKTTYKFAHDSCIKRSSGGEANLRQYFTKCANFFANCLEVINSFIEQL